MSGPYRVSPMFCGEVVGIKFVDTGRTFSNKTFSRGTDIW